MKICSWNVWCDNDPKRAFAYIQSLSYDVLCLQEVTQDLLELLQTLPVGLVYEKEGRRIYPNRTIQLNYSVILSRYAVAGHGTIVLPEFSRPGRARLISKIMHWSYSIARQALYADLIVEGSSIRVVCAHLTLSTPPQRRREVAALAEFIPPGHPAIVAGDLNILESLHILPFNWIQGAHIKHASPFSNERRSIEREFSLLGLKNPLRGHITHRTSWSQLDHILLTKEFAIESAQIVRGKHGSDHHPICVTANLQP